MPDRQASSAATGRDTWNAGSRPWKPCPDTAPHPRHEWLDGVKREDCPGVSAATISPKARLRMEGGEGFVVHICADCGYVEGEMPQAGCCSHCGRASDPLVCWATVNHHAEVERV